MVYTGMKITSSERAMIAEVFADNLCNPKYDFERLSKLYNKVVIKKHLKY